MKHIFYQRQIIEDLPPEAFMPDPEAHRRAEVISRPNINFWSDVWRRFRKNRVAMTGLVIIVLLVLLCVFGPLLAPTSYEFTNMKAANLAPSGANWFGTDKLGRDLWARVWVGGRISLVVGVIGAVLPTIFGVIVGGISGYFGGKLDMIIMRIIDIIMCIPSLIYIILIMLYLGTGILPIVLAISMTGWMGTARSIRALVMQLKVREFVLAARALGSSPMKIILRHLIPNCSGIIVVSLSLHIPSVIFQEAYLSFIGLGIQSPMTSWGQLAQIGGEVYRNYPYQLLIPSAVICLVMLAFNLFGDGLRDSLDPRLRD